MTLNEEFVVSLAENVGDMLAKNKDKIEDLRQVKEAADWYRKTKEAQSETGKAEAIVVNKIIESMQEIFPGMFVDITFETVDIGKDSRHLDFTYTYSLPPIKPFIEFELEILNPPLRGSFLKIMFQVESAVQIEGELLSSGQKKELKIEEMSLECTFYALVKMILGQKKVKIDTLKLSMENITLVKSPRKSERN